jgi:hypothetical protein
MAKSNAFDFASQPISYLPNVSGRKINDSPTDGLGIADLD